MNNDLIEWLNGEMKDLVVFDKETNRNLHTYRAIDSIRYI